MSKVRILDIREFESDEKLDDFYCRDLHSHLRIHSKNITAPHKHNFFLTVLFTQGSGSHEIDFEKHRVVPGSVFMLNPGQAHHWELSDDADGIIFFHSQDFFDVSFTDQSIYDFPFFNSVRNSSALFLDKPETEYFKSLFEQILSEYNSRDHWARKKLSALLCNVYIDLSRCYLANVEFLIEKANKYAEYVVKLEHLIEKDFKAIKSPAAYAEKLNITKRHLNRLTQETLGKSTTQLITERVMLEAKRLIVYGQNTLAEISYELGYEDYAYFSRLFKKWTGYSPKEFGRLYMK